MGKKEIDFAELREMAKECKISTAMKKKDVLHEEVMDTIAVLHEKGEASKAMTEYYNKHVEEEAAEPEVKGKKKAAPAAPPEEPEEKAEKVKAAAGKRKAETEAKKKPAKPISKELNESQEKAIKILKKGKTTKESFCKQYGCEPAGVGGIIGNLRRKNFDIVMEDGKIVLND